MLMINVRHNWTETFPYSMVRFKRSTEFVLLHFRSKLNISVGEHDLTVEPGGFIVLSPEVPYKCRTSAPYTLDFVYVIGNIADLMHMYGLEPNILYQLTNSEEIVKNIENLEFEFYMRNSWWYRYVDIKFEEILILVSKDVVQKKKLPMDVELAHRMQFLRLEMSAYPERDWSVKYLANRIGISESRVFPLYKLLFGISPNRDLIQLRVEKAKKLLEQGMNIDDVAEASGYNNVYHFIRQFHQLAGLSPYKYATQTKNMTKS